MSSNQRSAALLQKFPTMRATAARIALAGLGADTDLRDIVLELDAVHTKGSLFPGFALLDLAADALEFSGASRAEPSSMTAYGSATSPRSTSVASTSTARVTTRCVRSP